LNFQTAETKAVIASEAKQSMRGYESTGLLFFARSNGLKAAVNGELLIVVISNQKKRSYSAASLCPSRALSL
jgi:tRNA-binding EMAP/Myf-like protein